MNNNSRVTIECHPNRDPYVRMDYTIHLFRFRIHTTVTDDPGVIIRWLHRILHVYQSRRHRLVVGLSVQYWDRFSYVPVVPVPATLQLCIGSDCLIVKLMYKPVPNCLLEFLRDPRYIFVGHWNGHDAAILLISLQRLQVHRLVDVLHVAQWRRGLRGREVMQRLAATVLRLSVRNPMWLVSNVWDIPWLHPDQVLSACVDAFTSFFGGRELRAWEYWAAHYGF